LAAPAPTSNWFSALCLHAVGPDLMGSLMGSAIYVQSGGQGVYDLGSEPGVHVLPSTHMDIRIFASRARSQSSTQANVPDEPGPLEVAGC